MPTDLSGIRVDLGPIAFNQLDDGGVWRVLETVDGWDGADVRTDITPRQGAHGSWMGPGYLSERVLTLTGSVSADTPAALEAAVEQLLAVLPLDGFVTLTVYESVPKRVSVRQSGKPIVTRQGPYDADVSLLVTAPDPRRYGTDLRTASTALPSTSGGLVLPAAPPWVLSAVTVSGFISISNEGSMGTLPVFTIAGPVQQPSITVRYPDGSTQTLAYSQTLGAGDLLVLDTAEHTAVLGGASRRRYLSGPWPEIPPGGTADVLFGAAAYDPSALLTATWRPAWK